MLSNEGGLQIVTCINLISHSLLLLIMSHRADSQNGQLKYNLSDFEIVWWHYPPYAQLVHDNNSDTSTLDGVIPKMLSKMLNRCVNFSEDIDDAVSQIKRTKVQNPYDFEHQTNRNSTTEKPKIVFCFPYSVRNIPYNTWRPTEVVRTQFLPIIDVPASVHFYKAPDEAVGSDLLNVILQGWPMLILILLGAGYSGIIIWLLDRLWNPGNFPKPFIRGFWEGFWWAFVTMTTVGYGDTTPRSIQARVYGLVWIVIGITILSVFTATVTTVLTQESLGGHQFLQGAQIGVINSTQDFRLAITEGARPIAQDTFEEIISMLEVRAADGGLIDQYAFAAYQDSLPEDYLVERMVTQNSIHGILLSGGNTELFDCMYDVAVNSGDESFIEMLNWISPITVKTTTAAENAENLFQPRTVQYMWFGLAAWVVVFLCFVVWEFVYWRPKHKRRKAVKEKRKLGACEGDKTNIETDLNRSAYSTTCFGCDPDEHAIASRRNSAVMFKPVDPQTLRHNNGYIANGPVAKFYPNLGFNSDNEYGNTENIPKIKINHISDSDLDSISRSMFDSNSLNHSKFEQSIQSRELDKLISQQRDEISKLYSTFKDFKKQWKLQLKDTERIHRKEQQQYIQERLERENDNDSYVSHIDTGGAQPVNVYEV